MASSERRRREGRGRTVVFEPAEGKPPKDLRPLIESADGVFRDGLDPLSLEGVKRYFRDVYWRRGPEAMDAAALGGALRGIDSVIHLAAEVGVGQSMYAVDRYVSVNEYGTAVLFQKLIENPVRRVVTASSMSIYGEGLYRDVDGCLYDDVVRCQRAPATDWAFRALSSNTQPPPRSP